MATLALLDVAAQKKTHLMLVSTDGRVSEITALLHRKYKRNFYTGIPHLVGDSIKTIYPSEIDFAVVNEDTLFSWVRNSFSKSSDFNQFVKKVYDGKAIKVFITRLTDYGYFYLIKKEAERDFILLIDEPRLLNPVEKGFLPGNPGYIEATNLKRFSGLDVLSFQSERSYIEFLIDYFSDSVLLVNKFKSEFYTSKDFLVAIKEYDRYMSKSKTQP